MPSIFPISGQCPEAGRGGWLFTEAAWEEAMDLNSITLFQALQKRMEWLNQRQKVLAENIANADTPGYRPRDLKQPSFSELLHAQKPKFAARTTRANHIATGSERPEYKAPKQRRTYEEAPDGNAVSLEEQMLKVAENRIDYELTVNLYRKQVGLIKAAIGGK